ncbi:MAG: aminotransferase class V-fold PLP-dependent enzyme [Clostridia bacterium]|nr:aminotransferase class V-fold PLP-dependent enzyme [Clostridia bacterium]
MIYLDNAATTMMKPSCVAEAVTAALTSLGNASRGAHEGALNTNRLLYKTRGKLAAFFGCPKSEQVIFTNNSTEALNIAISGTLRPGDHAITTVLEHNSVLRPLYRLQVERGVSLSFVHADRRGCIDYADFERLIQPSTRAIVCTHASNLTGNLLDIRRIGAIAAAHGLLFIVDASQTAGVVPIDMVDMGISLLCFTGHKSMMGPQGTGGLLINGDIEVEPFKVGGTGVQSFLTGQPREYPTRLEAGTLNGHGIAGLSAAVDFIRRTGIDAIRAHEIKLARRFCEAVSAIPGVVTYGDFTTWERCPVVALNIGNADSALVCDALSCDYGIATRAGAHCAPLMHRAMGTEQQGAVRFSFGYYNTDADVDAAVQAVSEIAERISQ